MFLLWKIGKFVSEKRKTCINIVEKCSNHYSYLFGNSYLFTRENIWLMEKFYLMFPIFNSELEKITWNQYKLLFTINNIRERYFYFYISLFFNYDYKETQKLLDNNYYFRI